MKYLTILFWGENMIKKIWVMLTGALKDKKKKKFALETILFLLFKH
jgi:hypothetical protein